MFATKSEREIISVGVDYLTVTARGSRNRRALNRIGTMELDKERICGNDVSEFRLFELGGLRSGAVEYATCHKYDMLRISSHVASERWREVVQVADNVSRLDIQVTVRFTPESPNLAEHVERSMKRFKRMKNTRLEIELRRNDVKGKTLYTGSRKSDLFSRLYDKGRESRLPELAGCWRLESQFMNGVALDRAHGLMLSDDFESDIYSLMVQYYQLRGAGGIIPRLMERPSCVYALTRPKHAVSSRRKLDWLSSQVRPYVIAQRELGNLSAVLDALGLSDLLGPTVDHEKKGE